MTGTFLMGVLGLVVLVVAVVKACLEEYRHGTRVGVVALHLGAVLVIAAGVLVALLGLLP